MRIINPMLKAFQYILLKYGISFERVSPSSRIEVALIMAMHQMNLSMLIDVGANKGQFARKVRVMGYSGHIVCIEPIRALKEGLQRMARKDTEITIFCGIAISNKAGIANFNISRNSVSSSINRVNKRHIGAESEASILEQQPVDLIPLNTFLNKNFPGQNVALKLDVQGHENVIIDHIKELKLENVKVILVELSRVKLYEGSATDNEVISTLTSMGFSFFYTRRFRRQTYREMLQYDALFVKE